MRSAAAFLCALTAATAALAQDDDVARCTTLSFAPLDVNIPACSALIDNAHAFDGAALGAFYAARAEAYEFAITYRSGHSVSAEALLTAALADLDRAVQADRRHHAQRADILYRLSRYGEAAEGYTMALANDPTSAPSLLERRSVAHEAAGDAGGAIDDMSAAIGLSNDDRTRLRFLLRRAGLRETAHDLSGATDDYEAVLHIDAAHPAARKALERLGDAER